LETVSYFQIEAYGQLDKYFYVQKAQV